MGKDVKWYDYFKDNHRYADIINGIGCKGQQVVSHEDLAELDTRSKKKVRDLVCKAAFGMNFAIIGIENQDEVDYEFPVRMLEYDATRYRQQVSAISKSVREKPEGLNSGEYMYGFKKDNKLHPVITFILYAGVEPWDGPLCLHDIIDFSEIPDALKELVQNYQIKVVDIRRLEDTSMFRTDVRHVFDFIRCAEEWDALYNLVSSDPYYQKMDEEAYEVIAKYANIKDEVVKMDTYKRKDGGVNVCKGIYDLMENSRAEGKEEGREEGREEGISLGEEKERRNIVINMLKKNKQVQEICELIDCDTDYVERIKQDMV